MQNVEDAVSALPPSTYHHVICLPQLLEGLKFIVSVCRRGIHDEHDIRVAQIHDFLRR